MMVIPSSGIWVEIVEVDKHDDYHLISFDYSAQLFAFCALDASTRSMIDRQSSRV
jgi:hypothetical protein